MHNHDSIALLFLIKKGGENFKLLRSYLKEIASIRLNVVSQLPTDLSGWDAVVTSIESAIDAEADRLATFVAAGGGWLNIIGPNTREIPSLFGLQPEPAGPQCELRVLFDRQDHPISVRLADAIYVRGYHQPLVFKCDDIETILYADWRLQHNAVLVQRRWVKGVVACSTLRDFEHPVLCQIFYRLIRYLSGTPLKEHRMGVGILGYAPSVGQYHGQGIAQTSGLELHAACDLSPERLQQARIDFPDIRTHSSAKALCKDPKIDVVIIATPPNTHAKLAIQLMTAGKHVICEKPLALNSAETSAMVKSARQYGVHLSCHQNRRWDVDYLAIKQMLADDLIGDLFYLETFVGGFSHPCGYWHSDAAVSGGAAYDWGAHYIDWIVSLLNGRIEAVTATRHKRVWHDVTNADQECIQIRFRGGAEAHFLHSDIAAVPKPKWYLLGTRGAIVGKWSDVAAYETDTVHYYHRHDIPITEMPSEVVLYQRHRCGKINMLKPANPDRSIFGFHLNLADHLLSGEPIMAPLKDSVRVVAVLEAAARSMASGGSVEVLNV